MSAAAEKRKTQNKVGVGDQKYFLASLCFIVLLIAHLLRQRFEFKRAWVQICSFIDNEIV